MIHKGEVYERQIFSIKDKHFKAENFLDTVKQDYTNLINQYVWDKSQRLEVFERGGMYLATKKIGKNNPKATEIEADNSKRTLWNQTVDRAIVTGVSKSEIMQIKKERITDKIVESVWLYGNRPNLLSSIIGTAIAVLELLISKVFLKTLELADKVISKELEARPENTDFKEQKAVPEESRKQTDTPKPAIPPRPQPSPEAVSYKHLCEIYQKLQEQNKAIFALEKQRSDLEIELSDSKGIFKAKRRSELSTEIAGLEERISRMKARLSHIVKEYGYQNAEAFYKAFHKSETAYGDYQDSLKNWKQRYGRVANVCRIVGPGKIMVLRVPNLVTKVRAHAVPREPPVQHLTGHSRHIRFIADKPCPVSSHAIAHLTEFLVRPLEETVSFRKRNGRDRRRFLDQCHFLSWHLCHFPLEQRIIGKGFLFLADANFFPSIQYHKKTAFLVLFADL